MLAEVCSHCRLGAEHHERGRVEYPWCMLLMQLAVDPRALRIQSRGTWAYRHIKHVNGAGEVTWTSMFWRDAVSLGRGRSHGLPRVREFIGTATCELSAGQRIVIDHLRGARVIDAPSVAPPALPHLSFAQLRAAHRRAFSGQRRHSRPEHGRGARNLTTIDAYDRRSWDAALRAQSRPMSKVQIAALLFSCYSGAGLDADEYERLRWRLEPVAFEAACMAEHRRRRVFTDNLAFVAVDAGLRYVSIGGRARDGGPAIAKALRERGLIGTRRNRNEITPEGRAFCERIIPVLTVCSFVTNCGNSWKVEQLRQRRAGAEVAA